MNFRILGKITNEWRNQTAAAGLSQRVRDFHKHQLGGDKILAQLARRGTDLCVMLVAPVEQGYGIESVSKDRLH